MGQWFPLPSFGKGELSPALYGRIDLAAYSIGAKKLENFIVQRAGGIKNRPGSRYVGEVKSSAVRNRNIGFAYNTEQTYVLEFGNQTMRVVKNGAYVLVPSGGTPSTGSPAYSGATAYVVGNHVLQGGVVYYCIAATTGNSPPNVTYWYPLSMQGGQGIVEIPVPYLEANLPELKFMQSADVMTFTHRDWLQREVTRFDHHVWIITSLATGPQIGVPGGLSGSWTGTATTFQNQLYKVTAVHQDTQEEGLPSTTLTISCGVDDEWNAGEYATINWGAVTSAGTYNIYKSRNGIFGFIGQADGLTFRDIKYAPDTLDTIQVAKTPFSATGKYPQCSTYYEQRSVYGGSRLRPQGMDLSQSGQFKNFNVSVPSKDDDAISRNIAAEQVNEIRHFVAIKELLVLTSGGVWKVNGGGQSDVITPASMNVRRQSGFGVSHVRPLVIGDTVLYVQTKGSIVRDMGYSFQADNYIGADLTVLSNHLFDGYTIQEWAYAEAPNSTVYAVRNDGVLLTITYLREQEMVAWTHHVTDGFYESVTAISEGNEDAVYVIVRRLVNGVYKRYQERFDTRQILDQDDAFFVDSGLSYDGRVQAGTVTFSGGTTWGNGETFTATLAGSGILLAAGNIGDRFRIRIPNGVFDVDTGIEGYDDYNVDITAITNTTVCTVRPVRTLPPSLRNVAITGWSFAIKDVGGLGHLEGKEVTILIDGNVHPRRTVTAGAISLQDAGVVIHVGLPYMSELETMPIGDTQGGLGKVKKLVKLGARVDESRGFWAGTRRDKVGANPDFTNMIERKRDPTWSPVLDTTEFDLLLVPDFGTSKTCIVQQRDPLPLSITMLFPEVQA